MSYSPTMEVPVPNVDELELDKFMASGRQAKEVISRRQNLKKLIKECEAEIESLDKELGTALDLRNIRNATWEDYLLIRRKASDPSPILDRVLLIEAGVTPQQLSAGTRYGEPGKPGITIRNISKAETPGYDKGSRE